MRRLLRISLWVLAGILILLVIFFIVLNTRYGRELIRAQAEAFLRNKLNTEVVIGGIDYVLPRMIAVRDVLLLDQEEDTLLAAGNLKINIRMLQLLRNQVDVPVISLERTQAYIYRYRQDTVFNFEYIIQAFSSPDAASADTATNGSAMQFRLGGLHLRDIRFRYHDYAGGSLFSLHLDTLDLTMKELDPDHLRFGVDRLMIAGLEGTFIQDSSFLPVSAVADTASTPILSIAAEELDLRRIRYVQENKLDGMRMDITVGSLLVHPQEINLDRQYIALKELALQETNVRIVIDKTHPDMPEEIKTETADTILPWRILAADIRLAGVNFSMDDKQAPRQPNGIDYAHLDVRNLSLHVQQLFYNTDTIAGNLKQLAVQEHSGLDIRELRTRFAYYPQGAVLRDLYLQTPYSLFKNYIAVSYPSLESISRNPALMKLSINLDNSVAGIPDLSLFVPQLTEEAFFQKHKNGRLLLHTKISGTTGDIHIHHFRLGIPGSTIVELNGHVKGLPETDRLQYNLQLAQLQSGRADLEPLLPASVTSTLRLPDWFQITGSVAGTIDTYRPDLYLRSTDGELRLKGYLAMNDTTGNESYELSLAVKNLHAGNLIQDTSLGVITAGVHIQGAGFDPKTMQATMNGTIDTVVYNAYTYHRIMLSGSIAAQKADYALVSHDPNADIQLTGNADLSGTYPAIAARLNIDSIDLQALGFTSDAIRLRAMVHMDMPVLNPDYPEGTVGISRPTIAAGGNTYFPDSIYVVAAPDKDSGNHILLHAGMLHARLWGHAPLTKTGAMLSNQLEQYFPLPDTIRKALQPDSLSGSSPPHYDLHLYATVSNHPLLRALAPELKRMDTIRLDAELTERTLAFQASIPDISYGSYQLSNAAVRVNGADSLLAFHTGINRFTSGSMLFRHVVVEANVKDRAIDTDISIADKDSVRQFAMSASLKQEGQDRVLQLGKGLILDYNEWEVTQPNQIVFSDQGFYIRNFGIRHQDEYLNIHSVTPAYNAPLDAAISNFMIANITRMISGDTLLANGVIDGEVQLLRINPDPEVVADLRISHLAILGDTLGDLKLSLKNTGKDISANMAVTGNGNDIRLTGSWYPEPVNGNNLNMNLRLAPLKIKTFEALTDYQIRQSSGSLNGSLHIKGTTAKPVITGKLITDKLSTNIAMLNSRVTLPDETILFNEGDISFRNFIIEDSSGNKASLSGKVITEDFANMGLDLRIRANKWQAMNATEKDNKDMYGKLFLTTNIDIKGPVSAPAIEGKLDILKGTDVTIAIPESEVHVQEREGVVEFVNIANPQRYVLLSRQRDTVVMAAAPTGAEVNMNITLDEHATFSVIIDQSTGDFLKVRGRADLNTSVAPDGTLGLAGNYEIMDGSYQLNYNFIRRLFRIQSGSKIIFSGEPTDAETEITAIYEANVAPYDLVEKQVADPAQLMYYKQRLPFEVHMKLEGPLLKPLISFDIVLPREKSYRASSDIIDLVQGKLTDLRNNPSELNKQVFSLIILSRFVAENPFESGAGGGMEGIARQSASRFISEQLNKFAGGLVEGLDLTMDLATSEDYTSGQKRNRTDLNIGASKSLLNDRLTVSVGNNFQLEGPRNNSTQGSSMIPGNIAVDYDFTADRRYRVRFYRRNEDAGIRGFVIKTGASFIYTVEYNRFRELLVNRKKERALRAERRRQRTINKDSTVAPAIQEPNYQTTK